MFEIVVDAGRTIDFTVSLYEDDGSTAVNFATGDVVRFKLSRNHGTPILDVDSVAALSGGSLITATNGSNEVTVRLGQDDTSDLYGVYSGEVTLVDDSETGPTDAIKAFEKGVVAVRPSAGGDVGKT